MGVSSGAVAARPSGELDGVRRWICAAAATACASG